MNREEFQQFKAAEQKRLQDEINALQKQIDKLNNCLSNLETDIRNHIYDSVDDAMGVIEDMLFTWARDACEGSYCMGDDKYTQEFVVDGTLYEAVGMFEYNRHDKQYYYVDGRKFSYQPIGVYTEKGGRVYAD